MNTLNLLRRTRRVALPLLTAVAASLLAACGSGDPGPEVVVDATRVPASASASPVAFTRYVDGLVADEGREPLLVDGLVPPTSETDEPAAVSR